MGRRVREDNPILIKVNELKDRYKKENKKTDGSLLKIKEMIRVDESSLSLIKNIVCVSNAAVKVGTQKNRVLSNDNNTKDYHYKINADLDRFIYNEIKEFNHYLYYIRKRKKLDVINAELKDKKIELEKLLMNEIKKTKNEIKELREKITKERKRRKNSLKKIKRSFKK
ncbi:hypothetical protein [Psychromonas aquatilis]|uniref:Uncharacterized protein n=1 Tax=Psychromonas aquatilis TaxID=2005072 RepID=A0ABU9GRH6_9GAMM